MFSKTNKTAILLLLNAFLFTFSVGINAVSFPFILYQNQVEPFLIGVAESIEILAGVLIAKFLYSFSHKFGVLKIIIVAACLEALIILALPFYLNIFWWTILCFFSGFCWFSIIALRQSWLNIAITDRHRSMVLALNSTMICAGFALGPMLVKLIGAGKYLILIISAIMTLVSCLSLYFIRKNQPQLDKEKTDYWQIIKDHKSGLMARFLLDLQCMVIILFTVIYGIKNGLSAENAGLLVSVFMLVGLADIAIGWLIRGKHLPSFINIGFFGAMITIAFLPWAIKDFAHAMLIYLVYGWFISLIFISIITKVNHNQSSKDLVSINSALQAFGNLGAVCGTFLVGIFMEIFAANGFVILIVLANLIYFLVVGINKFKHRFHLPQHY